MGFYSGDTFNFILNIPTLSGSATLTSAPTITVLDISNPGSPIVTGASMTLITGTSFLYYYSFASPNASPKDYVAIYNYALSNSESLGSATAASWDNGIAYYTFPLPLPANTIPGNKLTTTGFTPSGFNVTNTTIQSTNPKTGVVTVGMVANPGSAEIFNLTGNAQIIAGIPNVGTAQVSQITNGVINPGDSVTIASATTSNLNGAWVITSAVLVGTTWTITFYTTGSVFSSTAQSAGTLTNNLVGVGTTMGTGSAIVQTTVSNQLIASTDKLHIGDSYITGQVALSSTVALNSTVAKDATVMKSSQYIAPMNDPTVQAINTSVGTILSNTNSQVTLLGTLSQGTVSGLLQDVYDNVFGSWSIDQVQNPPVLSIKRINGSVIATFQLVNNSSVTQRNVITSPPESNV